MTRKQTLPRVVHALKRAHACCAAALHAIAILALFAAIAAPGAAIARATATTTSLSSSVNPAAINQTFVLTATVSPSTATGTVTFNDGSTVLGTASLVNGRATLNTSFSTSGSHSLTASYAGNSSYRASKSAVLTETVTVTKIPTLTTMESFYRLYSIGETVQIDVGVRNDNSSSLSGTISIYDGTTVVSSGSVVPYPGYPGLYHYVGTYTLTTAGDHPMSAKYSGDGLDAPSATSVNVLKVPAQTIPTTLQVSLAGSGPFYVNAPVAVSAVVNPASASIIGVMTQSGMGTVTLKDGTTTVGTININYNGAGEFSGSGSATFTSTGTRSLTASYSGRFDLLPSSLGQAIPVTVTAKLASTTSIDSTASPAGLNQPFSLTALVSGSGSTPTGSVTFKDGTATLGTANLANGYATYPVSFSATGNHSFSATYNGDNSHAGSSSSSLSVTINSLTGSQTSLSATPNPVSPGEPLLLAATTTTGATGTITFKDGATTLGTATLSNGQASLTTSLSTTGVHYLTASYGGNSTYDASKSLAVAVQVGSGVGLTSPGAMTWLYSRDASGNVIGTVDPNGNTSSFGYDALNNNTSIVLPPANARTTAPVITNVFDYRSRLVSVTDPRANRTTYAYDGLSEVAPRSTTSPDAGASSVTFDANHNVVSMTDARGKTKTLGYDDLNRLKSITYASGTPTAFEYDGGANPAPYSAGRLTKITDESGSSSYAYDLYGRVITKSITAGSTTFNVRYAWGTAGPAAGKLASITYPSGSVVNYSYDMNGRLSAVSVNPVNVNGQGANLSTMMTVLSGATYNALDRVTGWNWSGGLPYARTYDSYGRLASYTLGNPAGAGAASGLTRTLGYDNAGQIASYTHTNSAGAQSAYNQSFGYDGLSRLFSASIGSTWYGYDYDANGNRTDRVIGSTDYQSSYSATSNQLTSEQTPLPSRNSYTHDAAGNVTYDGAVTYAYNDRGRLASATTGSGTVNYLYNGLEQRVSKTGSLVPTGAAYFVYDERGRLLGEYDSNGVPTYETIYAGSTLVGVMKQTGSAGAGTLQVNLYNVYADQIDTPRVVTRQSDSAIVWRWDMAEPYGATPPNANPNGLGTFVFNQRFPGQVFDQETGLFQNGFRYYDAATGRYKSFDPIGLVGGPNGYAYGGGSPTMAVDPSGLAVYRSGNEYSDRIAAERDWDIARVTGDNITGWDPVRVPMGGGDFACRAGGGDGWGGNWGPKPDGGSGPGPDNGFNPLKFAWDAFGPDWTWLLPEVKLVQAMAAFGKVRKKAGSLGKFKGTDALRRENDFMREAARQAGLTGAQAQRFHIGGSEGATTLEDLVEIAKTYKYGK